MSRRWVVTGLVVVGLAVLNAQPNQFQFIVGQFAARQDATIGRSEEFVMPGGRDLETGIGILIQRHHQCR